MTTPKLLIVATISSYILGLSIFWWGNLSNFKIDDFNSILNVLLTISSIVFAIVGAWIAIIYPNAIRKYFTEGRSSVEAEAEKLGITTSALQHELKEEFLKVKNNLLNLVDVVILSSLVLLIALATKVAHPVLESFSFLGVNLILLKVFALSLLIWLAIVQFFAIFQVMKRNYDFYIRLNDEYEKAREKTRKY